MPRRLTDICVAFLALVLLSPLLLFIAIAIPLDSPGNPLYGGWRIGRDGRKFRMWKFRSMVVDADKTGPGITARQDSRVTRLGSFLRKSKLDELPQFLNLLVGDLTLIGPRPEVPDIVEKYSPQQRKVLQYTPGITGVGAIDYTNTQAHSIPPNVSADLYYLEHLLDPKLRMEVEYEESRRFSTDLGVIYCTALLVCKSIVGRTGQSTPQVVRGTGDRRSGPLT